MQEETSPGTRTEAAIAQRRQQFNHKGLFGTFLHRSWFSWYYLCKDHAFQQVALGTIVAHERHATLSRHDQMRLHVRKACKNIQAQTCCSMSKQKEK
ncbi:hypothetical protein KDH_34980 [Dictyobacter sp. S3.2.2.5]|uniref:Uncharacterized protein n=1 Tax=Dictyobacter halimunensis TaxID=3026934 RepID=A0ABQ6FR01_9CHLR|nr:hypothetical protein KDH_34980 [Dictyobacter sp. S3.2.2.5]